MLMITHVSVEKHDEALTRKRRPIDLNNKRVCIAESNIGKSTLSATKRVFTTLIGEDKRLTMGDRFKLDSHGGSSG